jgi:tetratricopeptide (TPR) repeat protein
MTVPGDLLGTLRYMSPEQALAKHDLVDHRTDIYALGATLYELLTGRPAVGGQERQEILQRILAEEPVPPRRHQASIPRDLETVVLKALAKEPQGRYATAKEMAEDLDRFLADVPVRARRPGLGERAVKWARRHRTLVSTVLAGLLVALVTLGGSVGWVLRDEAARAAEAERVVSAAVREAETLARQKQWPQALQAAERAAGHLAGRHVPEELGRRARRILKDMQMVAKLEKAYADKIDAKRLDLGDAEAEAGHRNAFVWYGLEPERLDAAQAATQIRGRLIETELAAALDDWALLRQSRRRGGKGACRHLLAVARAGDPDGWRNEIRDAVERWDVGALRRLGRHAGGEELPAATAVLLAKALSQARANEEAVGLLREAQRRHPADLWVNTSLAITLHELASTQPGYLDEAIGFHRVALALRPESATLHNHLGVGLAAKGRTDDAVLAFRQAIHLRENYPLAHLHLGNALGQKGQRDGAIACYRKAIQLQEGYPAAHNNLGKILQEKGQLDEAIASFRKAIRLKPDWAEAHHNLGRALQAKGQLDEAITAYGQAIRLRKDFAPAHNSLGVARQQQGRLAEAVAAYRAAIAIDRNYFKAHLNLGVALYMQGRLAKAVASYRQAIHLNSDHAGAHTNLGFALLEMGRADEAITAYRQAIRLDKTSAEAHHGLGNALLKQGRPDEAIAPYREAVRLKGDHATAHNNLGLALAHTGRLDEAIAAWRQAVRVRKDYATAHYNLGNGLRLAGQLDEAVAVLREAVRLKGDYAEAHCVLGLTLFQKGDLARALPALRRGHEQGARNPPWPLPSARWLRECERLADLDARLPAILRGEEVPTDPDATLDCAWLCLKRRRLYGAAARFYRQAFDGKPALATAPALGHRYRAACAAALAGTGQGKDAADSTVEERANGRRQAREWLRADLTRWLSDLKGATPQHRRTVLATLRRWLRDPDLAGVRATPALERLPPSEREAWLSLWSDLKQALPQGGAGAASAAR